MTGVPNPARAEYQRRLHRVLATIDATIGEPLSLERLAEVAHFSPYHFHRLFTAWTGETLGEYLRRRRLEVAALHLISQPGLSVLAAALRVGFGSGEAFSRAFKAHFGASPSLWRQQQASKPDQALRKLDQAPWASMADDLGLPELPEHALNVQVIQREAVRVAYLRHIGPYGAPIHRFWQAQFHPFLVRHQLTGRVTYGISHDDPTLAPPDKLRYDCCVELDADAPVPTGALSTTIAPGRYASLPFFGNSAQIADTWRRLMREWLPQSGWQLDGRPTFEVYHPNARYDEATHSFECEIVIPLAPL